MIAIVDGNNLAHVANYGRRLTCKPGYPTQAIYGFVNSLHLLLDQFKPSHLYVVWDGARSAGRMAMCPEYKANRDDDKKTQEQIDSRNELELQMPVIKKALVRLGISQFRGENVEGDDLIARLAVEFSRAGREVVIFSNDKDFYQLIDERVSVFSTVNKPNRHIMHENMKAITGLEPSQWLDFRAMMGDPSDNIKGVKGVGEKTAKAVLQQYGTAGHFYSETVIHGRVKPPKLQKRIIEGWEDFLNARKLIDLKNIPVNFIDRMARHDAGPLDRGEVYRFFEVLEFNSILRQFDQWLMAFQCLCESENKEVAP